MTSAQEARSGLLWEVRSPSTRVFLLGTIHVGSRDLYPLPAAVESAYSAATALAVEADLSTEASIAAVGTRFVYLPPDNLERHIPPAPLPAGDRQPSIATGCRRTWAEP